MIVQRTQGSTIRILLIEDDPEDVLILEEHLSRIPNLKYELIVEKSLREGIGRVENSSPDVALLDLGLPDSKGMDTFMKMEQVAGHIPIIVLTGLDDRELGNRCVLSGAQDFLVKGNLSDEQLERSIWYSIDRKIAERSILEERDRAQKYLDIAGVVIIALDVNADITLINQKGAEILGYEDEEEIIGMNWIREFLPEDMRDLIDRVFHRCLAGEIDMVEYFENSIIRKDGTERLIAWHNSVIRDTDGTVIGTLSSGEDITTRTIASAALERSEKRLKAAQNIARIGHWELDILTDELIWSEETFRIFELDPSTTVSTFEDFQIMIHPGDRESVRQAYTGSHEQGTEFDINHRLLLRDGRIKHVNVRGRTLYDENEMPILSLGTIQDVTERILMQERQTLLGNILMILNRPNDWKILIRDILSEIKTMSGFEALAIRLRKNDDFPYYVSNGFPSSFIRSEDHLAVRESDGSLLRNKAGDPILRCICGQVIRGNPGVLHEYFTRGGSFWTNDLKRLHGELQQEIDVMGTDMNCFMAGYESVASIPLRSGTEIIGILQINDRRRNMFTGNLIEFYEELGTSIGIAFKRKQVEEELVHLNSELRMKSRELEQIMFVSSHDIRSPLVNIQGFTSELRSSVVQAMEVLDGEGDQEHQLADLRTIIDEDISESLTFINKNTRSIDDLNNGLLQFSRLAATEMSRSVLDMDVVVASVMKKFDRALAERGIRISIGPLPSCTGDEQFMKLAIVNIIDNAIKFIGQNGESAIRISGTIDDSTITYMFKDTGIGFDPKYHERIFDLFHRLDPHGSEGKGLGLTLVKRIIEKHEGDISVESEPGKGSTFLLRMPRKGSAQRRD